MKKIAFVTMTILMALILSCESDIQTIDETIVKAEDTVLDNPYLKLLEQNPNIIEILDFLNASSTKELVAKLAEKPESIDYKNSSKFSEYIYVTHQHNLVQKSSGEEKLVLFELSPERDALRLRSIINASEIDGYIESIYYDNNEKALGILLIEYDIEKQFFNITIDGDNSKRGCFHECMSAKGRALEESNWIDKLIFCASAVPNVAGWAISCAWDCR
ncbi:hypothetical protein [Perlabentimonas gracilis]|jgi:hypothetical protein|uniref:hypothetical protein n=1 Tax=Perlabentimonas gracilis TaxID=2715279 RepID=UPI00140B1CB5|nr:hypothetical protein [Perlabentimonas gracilis]NHB69962.1 hypothetical protein [Perlabentimonas gracilis]